MGHGVSIERKLQGKASRRVGAWLCSIALCLSAASCISPDLEPPSQGTRAGVPSTPNVPRQPGDGLANAETAGTTGTTGMPQGGSAAMTPTATTPGAAAGRGATPPNVSEAPSGAAAEAGDDGADAGVP